MFSPGIGRSSATLLSGEQRKENEMNVFKNLLIAGMCMGSICAGAYAADNQGNTPAPAKSSSWLAPGAKTDESYAKQAKEDFQLKKKRLENERDAALTRCAKEAAQAQKNCRQQANASFNSEVKREQLVYEEALHHGQSSGSSSSGSHASGAAKDAGSMRDNSGTPSGGSAAHSK
jgi:hypothetical protein